MFDGESFPRLYEPEITDIQNNLINAGYYVYWNDYKENDGVNPALNISW